MFDVQGFEIERLPPTKTWEVQKLYEQSADFVRLITGEDPRPTEADELFEALPPGKRKDDKFIIGVSRIPTPLIGVIDLVRDFPGRSEWYLGLFLLAPNERGVGTGARVMNALLSYLDDCRASRLRLAVQTTNVRAQKFWRRLGFAFEGKGETELHGRRQDAIRMVRRFGEPP